MEYIYYINYECRLYIINGIIYIINGILMEYGINYYCNLGKE